MVLIEPSAMSFQRVAVLGLGTMGAGMAGQLLKSGRSVVGFNRTRARARDLEGRGLSYLGDPAEAVENAEAIVVCLADDRATRAALLDNGALDRARAGALLIDCGTSGLELTAEMAARADARGIELLDAPVTGSKLGAEGGTLTFMVGGPTERVDRARPLFETMGRHVVHAGPRIGDGQRVKYCLNMIQAIVLQGVLEGYALARAQGVTIEALSEVLENSGGRTGVGSFKTPFLLKGDFTPHFRLDLMLKDLRLALGQAEAGEAALPLAEAVTRLYEEAVGRGLGGDDFLATARLLDLGPTEASG